MYPFWALTRTQLKSLKTPTAKTTKAKSDFTMKESTPAKSDYTATININKSTRANAQIHPTKEVYADLQMLQRKHPEMFTKPSDVYKLIQQTKQPTYFYQNPSYPSVSMMGKMLDDNKLGKFGINKFTNEVRHITKSSKGEKENTKLLNRGEKYPLVKRPLVESAPHSTQPVLPNGAGAMPGAKALSKGDKNPTPKSKTSQADKENQEKLPTQRNYKMKAYTLTPSLRASVTSAAIDNPSSSENGLPRKTQALLAMTKRGVGERKPKGAVS